MYIGRYNMKKKLISSILVAAMVAGTVVGCGGSGDSTQKGGKGSDDYDFYIFNTKGENADAMQACVDAYEEETGLTVKLFSLGSGTDSSEILRTELASKNAPTIFCCMNPVALVEFTEGGYAMDLADAENANFKKLVEEIPENLKLSDANGSYGIPFNIEGYGYIVDKEMLAAIYGADNVDAWIEAYKTATYDEFEAMVEATTAYIKDGTTASVTLSGQSFEMVAKDGLANGLEGVFSMAGSQTWTYGDHLINVFIDAAFKDAAAVSEATADQLDAAEKIFEAYAQVIDLKSSNAVIPRGADAIGDTTGGYDASVQNFSDGKALFLKQGNWAYTNIKDLHTAGTGNDNIEDTITFLPIKTPLKDSDIQSGLTADYMNQSISVFVPNYYVLNKKCDKDQLDKAEEFLYWLNTSETGQKFVIEDMAFVPYNADPATTSAGYSLGDSLIEYVAAGNTITNAYAGCPQQWTGDVVGKYILENYLNKEEWDANAYEDIAKYVISSWKEKKGL